MCLAIPALGFCFCFLFFCFFFICSIHYVVCSYNILNGFDIGILVSGNSRDLWWRGGVLISQCGHFTMDRPIQVTYPIKTNKTSCFLQLPGCRGGDKRDGLPGEPVANALRLFLDGAYPTEYFSSFQSRKNISFKYELHFRFDSLGSRCAGWGR